MKPHTAQGWYRDPYELHEDRYFSAGRATMLVRDAGEEGHDAPPDRPYDPAGLVPVPETGDNGFDGSDLRRADEAERSTPAHDLRRADDAESASDNEEEAERAAFDAFDQMMPPS